jgi:hypothetical protein
MVTTTFLSNLRTGEKWGENPSTSYLRSLWENHDDSVMLKI